MEMFRHTRDGGASVWLSAGEATLLRTLVTAVMELLDETRAPGETDGTGGVGTIRWLRLSRIVRSGRGPAASARNTSTAVATPAASSAAPAVVGCVSACAEIRIASLRWPGRRARTLRTRYDKVNGG